MIKQNGEKWWHSEFLNFRDLGNVSVGSVTRKYEVVDKLGGVLLGYVKWYNQWRKYCFFPVDAFFDHTCLRDIADFVEERTVAHKQNRGW